MSLPPKPEASAPRRMVSDVVRTKLRAGHYSHRTEEAYLGWIRRFIKFHGTRHPRELREAEVVAFLEDLAEVGQVSASTQNQALNALVFLYAQVLEQPLGKLGDFARRYQGRLGKAEEIVVGAHKLARILLVHDRQRATLRRGQGLRHHPRRHRPAHQKPPKPSPRPKPETRSRITMT